MTRVQLGNEAQKLYFATPVHTSGSLGIAGGVHTPQRVSWSRYEIVFRNALEAKLYFTTHAGCADLGDDPGLCEIEFRAQVRSQVQLLSLPTSFPSGYGIEMPT